MVISIIAVLAALAFPAFQRAIASSDRAACSGNLQQVGQGLLLFAHENDGMMPESGGTIYAGQIDSQTGLPGWTEQLTPYLGPCTNNPVYRCPGSAKVIKSDKTYGYFQGSHPAYAAANQAYAAVRINRIASPTKTIMGGDVAEDVLDPRDDDRDDNGLDLAFPRGVAGGVTIHGGLSNILFYDGHVAAFSHYDTNAMAVTYDGQALPYP